MENNYHNTDETIAAIATPQGQGGVAMIRISGKEAVAVANRIFTGEVPSYASHTAHYGRVVDLEGGHVDDVLVLPMLGKRSFTGEDTVEIHCHGGIIVSRKVLEVVLSAGARAAGPGEFSFRAFMNGKLDLAQAEAVQELIAAKNGYALEAAENQLQGRLSRRVSELQNALTEIAAILEAWVDFPEEGLEFASFEELRGQLSAHAENMQQLISTYHDGKILHEGLSLCLIGSPNVGKSSLMNALLEKDRAIVSEIPGTTRDIIEDYFRLNGLNIKLTDTAGIRESSEAIEQEGIRRSKKALEEADLILLILDASRPLTSDEEQLIKTLPAKKTIAVRNKMDLPPFSQSLSPLLYVVDVSAKKRLGLEKLHEIVDQVVWEHGVPDTSEVMITSARHYDALLAAHRACIRVLEGLGESAAPELLSIEMRECLLHLGKIIGTEVTEAILSSIFSKFCIGK